MSFSPEIRKLPELVSKFSKSEIVGELLSATFKGETGRDIIADIRRGLAEFFRKNPITVTGLENFPATGGCLLVFNHPNVEVLVPAFLTLVLELNDQVGRNDVSLVTGSEIPLFGRIDGYPLPGSIAFLQRFHNLYPDFFLPLPTVKKRKDYKRGRLKTVRRILENLEQGKIVALAPEGHVEINNVIEPPDLYPTGAGSIALKVKQEGSFQIVPVGIWQENDSVKVSVGKSVDVSSSEKKEAVKELMNHIANLLPDHLRGPFHQF